MTLPGRKQEPYIPPICSIVAAAMPVTEDDKQEEDGIDDDLEALLNLPRTWNVFVGDLKPSVGEEDLMTLFGECGPIDGVRIIREKDSGKSKGYGFIHFKDEDAKMRAMSATFNGANIKGWPCRVKPSEEKVTLFVGNLPLALNQNQVHAELEELVGPVYQCELKTGPPPVRVSRGFCFASFMNHRLANRARRILQQSRVQGRQLKVSWADGDSADRREVPSDIMSKVRTLYVSNIPVGVTVDALRSLFMQRGKVTNCVIVRHPITKESRGFAFVEYQRREDVDNAIATMNGIMFEGQRLNVTLAKPPPIVPGAREREPIRTVYVANLPLDVDADRLQAHFGEFGDVLSCKIVRHKDTMISKGYGFVEYAERTMADAACAARHQTVFGGKEITATIANPPASQRIKGFAGGEMNGAVGGWRAGTPMYPPAPPGFQGYPTSMGVSPRDLASFIAAVRQNGYPVIPAAGAPGGYPGADYYAAARMSPYPPREGPDVAPGTDVYGSPPDGSPGGVYDPGLYYGYAPFASPFAMDAAATFFNAYQSTFGPEASAVLSASMSLSDFDFHLDMSSTTTLPPLPQ